MAFSVARICRLSIGSGHAKPSASSRRRCPKSYRSAGNSAQRPSQAPLADAPRTPMRTTSANNYSAIPGRSSDLETIRQTLLLMRLSRQVGELAQLASRARQARPTRNAVHWKGTTEARKSGIRQAQDRRKPTTPTLGKSRPRRRRSRSCSICSCV